MLRAEDIGSVVLRWMIVRRNHLYENLLQVPLAVLLAKLLQRSLRQQLAGLDDADHIAKLLDLTHDVGREDYGFTEVAAFPDKRGDRSRLHDVEPQRRLGENHHCGIMHKV